MGLVRVSRWLSRLLEPFFMLAWEACKGQYVVGAARLEQELVLYFFNNLDHRIYHKVQES